MLGGFDPFIPFVVVWCLATSVLALMFAAQHALANRRRIVVVRMARQEKWTRRSVGLTTAGCESEFRHSGESFRLLRAGGNIPQKVAIFGDRR
jgi:hypothetical protein